jgi:hypothetical protein
VNILATLLALGVAFGSLGVQQASAQATPKLPPPPPPTIPSPGVVAPANADKPSTTKLVQIYNGAGYFNNALAEELRPMLAKAFPSSLSEAATAVPDATLVAPAKLESQKKVAVAHP